MNEIIKQFVQNFIWGHRLNTAVMKYVDAHTGPECVLLCLTKEKSCRSVNFRKASNCQKNCELLEDVASEKPKLLVRNKEFDHYLLLDDNRVSDTQCSCRSLCLVGRCNVAWPYSVPNVRTSFTLSVLILILVKIYKQYQHTHYI